MWHGSCASLVYVQPTCLIHVARCIVTSVCATWLIHVAQIIWLKSSHSVPLSTISSHGLMLVRDSKSRCTSDFTLTVTCYTCGPDHLYHISTICVTYQPASAKCSLRMLFFLKYRPEVPQAEQQNPGGKKKGGFQNKCSLGGCSVSRDDNCTRAVVSRLIYMCDMTHLYVWHDSSMCVTWLICMFDMTRLYVWHDSSICVTWLIDMHA